MKVDFKDLEVEVTGSGVLYIHDKHYGMSILRVCGLNRERAPAVMGEAPKQADLTITRDNILGSLP